MNSWFWFFFPILPGLGFAALGFILDSREVSGAKHFTKFSLALAGMVISLPLILNDVASSPTLVGIVLGVWIVRMLWVISIAMASQHPLLGSSVREPTRKELRGDMIGLAVTLVVVFVVYPWCADYAQQNVRKSAEAFYGQLQIGAAFDRTAFDQQIEDKGGRVRNFGNHREVMEAIWDRRTLYPIEVAVLAADDVERYHMWFRAPATWRTLWGSVTTAPVNYVFRVENGKIAGISGLGHGEYEYVRENGRGQWVRREEATRQRAEALYATLQLGASFNRSDFERQIAAMGGRVENFGNFALYDRRRNEAHWWGESRLNVAVISQGGDIDYYTDFFTPYPGFVHENPGKGLGVVSSYVFHVKDGIITGKAVWNGGGWVDFH